MPSAHPFPAAGHRLTAPSPTWHAASLHPKQRNISHGILLPLRSTTESSPSGSLKSSGTHTFVGFSSKSFSPFTMSSLLLLSLALSIHPSRVPGKASVVPAGASRAGGRRACCWREKCAGTSAGGHLADGGAADERRCGTKPLPRACMLPTVLRWAT